MIQTQDHLKQTNLNTYTSVPLIRLIDSSLNQNLTQSLNQLQLPEALSLMSSGSGTNWHDFSICSKSFLSISKIYHNMTHSISE